MSVLWGPITVDQTFLAPTQQARSAATQRRAAQTVTFRTPSAAASVSLSCHTPVKNVPRVKGELTCYLSLDINECVAHNSPCLPGQTCVNTVGSYTCRRNKVTCGQGYHLTEDGTRCEGRYCHNKPTFSNIVGVFFAVRNHCVSP